MNANQKSHQIRLAEWAARFADQKASGLTARQWCEQNNFTIHTYNYWKHLLKEEAAERLLPDIVPLELPVTSQSASLNSISCSAIRANCTTAKVSINGFDLEVDATISPDFLCTLLKAARHA